MRCNAVAECLVECLVIIGLCDGGTGSRLLFLGKVYINGTGVCCGMLMGNEL